jgi:hypothetical protein
MTGLLLLVAVLTWIASAVLLGGVTTSKLLPLPLADEIGGRRQFERLCAENALVQVNRAAASGKTVYLARTPDIEVPGTWVHIVRKPWRFVDASTGKTIVSYDTLMADGERLIRMLGISEGGVPLTFKGFCEPKDARDVVKLLKELQLTQVQRS